MLKTFTVLLAAWIVAACSLVPTRFDDSIAVGWTHLGVGVENLKTSCGIPPAEERAKVVLVAVVEFVATYSGYYGNDFDRAQALGMKTAVLGFDSGGGLKYCEEYAEQLRRRVERVAAVVNGRPRR